MLTANVKAQPKNGSEQIGGLANAGIAHQHLFTGLKKMKYESHESQHGPAANQVWRYFTCAADCTFISITQREIILAKNMQVLAFPRLKLASCEDEVQNGTQGRTFKLLHNYILNAHSSALVRQPNFMGLAQIGRLSQAVKDELCSSKSRFSLT